MAYAHELAFAQGLAREVGVLMSDSLRIGRDFELKVDGSTLTDLDVSINRRVIEVVQAAYPRDGVLGEEESALTGREERIWIVDPIDGTFPFRCGIPTSCVELALMVGFEPVLGVIYNPYVEQLFFAVQGEGAQLQDRQGLRRLEVNKTLTDLKGAPLGVTGSISGPVFDVPAVRSAADKALARPSILGSTGYELAMVVAGQFGGQLFGYPFRHDLAAAAVLIPEAGGKVTDVLGRPLDFSRPLRGAVSSNGTLHEELLRLVAPFIIAIGGIAC
jgi:fructose-1,6-bisphosphatase/inositol monophosphatase family enzyme